MNPLIHFLEHAVRAFNRARCWRGECQVWSQKMTAASFERWLYLQLHRLNRMGSSEKATLEHLVRPGMTVIEVGANLGLYTVLLSRLVGPGGHVIAFEPDPDLFALLQRNCSANGSTNVQAHQLAAGSKPSRLRLQKLVINSGDNHLGEGGSHLFRQIVETDVVALDQFLPGVRPDLIKIDVQGWEFEVLLGLEGLLRTNPHAELILELWPAGLQRAGCSVTTMLQWLHDRGYHLHRTDGAQPLTGTELEQIARKLTGLRHVDLIARHSTQPHAAGPTSPGAPAATRG